MQVLHKIYFCSSFLSSDSGTSSNFGNTKATHDHPKPNLEATFFTNLSDQSKPVSCSNLVLAKIPSDIFDKLYESAAGSFEQCPIAVATSKQGSKRLSALITQLSNTKHVAELKRDSKGRVPFIVPYSDEREIEVGEGEIKTRATLFICSIEVIVRAVKMEATQTQRAQKRAEERQRDEELKMSYITALHEQNSAASKIQSVIRMIKFKREFPRMKEEFIAARRIQSCMRAFLFRRLMGTLSRFRLAATKVQTIVRMWIAPTIRFKTLLMTTKSGSGVYCSEVEQDGQVLEYRIEMSDGECYDRMKRDNNNPKQSSHMCITTGEFTKIMEGCNEYQKAVKTLYDNCRYFKYETSRSDRREKGVANQLAELLMKALLLKSEDRELILSRRVIQASQRRESLLLAVNLFATYVNSPIQASMKMQLLVLDSAWRMNSHGCLRGRLILRYWMKILIVF